VYNKCRVEYFVFERFSKSSGSLGTGSSFPVANTGIRRAIDRFPKRAVFFFRWFASDRCPIATVVLFSGGRDILDLCGCCCGAEEAEKESIVFVLNVYLRGTDAPDVPIFALLYDVYF